VISKKIKYFLELIQKEKIQKKLKTINLFLSAISFFFIGRFILNIKNEKSFEFLFKIDETVLLIIVYFLSAYLWVKLMEANYQGNKWDYFFNWSYSKLGRYIPSGLMLISVRINQKIPKEKSPNKIFFGLLEEQFLAPFVSIPAAIIAILFGKDVGRLVLYVVFQIILFYLFRFYYLRLRSNEPSLIDYPSIYLLNLIVNLLFFIQVALNLNFQDPYLVGIYYALSSSLGLLFIGVPAGIGIREGIFLLISSRLGVDIELVNLIIKIRGLSILLDIVFGTLGLLRVYYKNEEV
tara:strand:+ start:56423 stop:57301 length:879 start_codon:yes stop_codon:yes gene_type:complete